MSICYQCGKQFTIHSVHDCCYASVVRDILKEEFRGKGMSREDPVITKRQMISIIKDLILPHQLLSKAIEMKCYANDISENLNRGAEEIFLHAMQVLKDQSVIYKNDFIEIDSYCPECGVKGGQPHDRECSIPPCSICGYYGCRCHGHDSRWSIWLGEALDPEPHSDNRTDCSTCQTIEYGWDSKDHDYDDFEKFFCKTYLYLPKNYAEGPSVYGHHVCHKLVEFNPGSMSYHSPVENSLVDDTLQLIKAVLFVVGRRFNSFHATVFSTNNKLSANNDSFENRIEGLLIRDGAVREFSISQDVYGKTSDDVISYAPTYVSEPKQFEDIPEHRYEKLFDKNRIGEVAREVGEALGFVQE